MSNGPHSRDPAPGRGEPIEELLAQAEAITDELSREAGVTRDDRPPSGPSRTPPLEDSLAHIDAVKADARRVEQAIDELIAAGESGESWGAEPSSPGSSAADDHPPASRQGHPPARPSDTQRPSGTHRPGPSRSSEVRLSNAAPANAAARTGSSSLGVSGRPSPTPSSEAQVRSGSRVAVPADQSGAGKADSNPPPPPPAPLRRLMGRLRGVSRLPAAVTTAGMNVCLNLIVALDRPFARLTLPTKRRIAVVALITLLMGLAAFILPPLFAIDPFEDF